VTIREKKTSQIHLPFVFSLKISHSFKSGLGGGGVLSARFGERGKVKVIRTGRKRQVQYREGRSGRRTSRCQETFQSRTKRMAGGHRRWGEAERKLSSGIRIHPI